MPWEHPYVASCQVVVLRRRIRLCSAAIKPWHPWLGGAGGGEESAGEDPDMKASDNTSSFKYSGLQKA